MSRKFRPRAKLTRHTYSYKPTDASIRSEEIAAYRRLAIALLLVVLFSAGLYLWGVDAVANLSSFWRQFFPNSSAPISLEANPARSKTTLLAPNLDPLPLRTNAPEKIAVRGWAQTGSEVKIFVNGSPAGKVLVDSSGRFSFADFNLIEGENNIYAIALKDNLKSKPSHTQSIVYDKTKPKLEVNIGNPNADEASVQVNGQTEASATVTINNHRAIVNLDGQFNYTLANLQPGENRIKIVAVDEAGNEAVVEKTIDYSPTEPETPTKAD